MKTTTKTYRSLSGAFYAGLVLAAVTATSYLRHVADASPDAARAAEPVPISACQKITRPGRYELARDLEATAGSDCIEILAARVDLDLNGFSILGVSNLVGAGVNANAAVATDAAIHDGSISGFWIGAVAHSASVEKLRISNVGNGLYVGSGAVVGNAIVAESIGVVVQSARVEGNEIDAGAAGISCGVSCLASGNVVREREGIVEVAAEAGI